MRYLPAVVAMLLVLVLTDSAAGQGRSCGEVRRSYTDAQVAVTVTKGSVSCRTARGVLLTYWRASPGAAARTRTIQYRGNRWRCGPERIMSSARAWGCSTARQRSIVAGAEMR